MTSANYLIKTSVSVSEMQQYFVPAFVQRKCVVHDIAHLGKGYDDPTLISLSGPQVRLEESVRAAYAQGFAGLERARQKAREDPQSPGYDLMDFLCQGKVDGKGQDSDKENQAKLQQSLECLGVYDANDMAHRMFPIIAAQYLLPKNADKLLEVEVALPVPRR